MSESNVSASVVELVYTAAAKLLNGREGLGIVAATKSIPNDFGKDLSQLKSYTLPQFLKDNLPDKTGERLILMPIKNAHANYLTFSRVSETSGEQYLKRSTIIVHHLATPSRELKNGKMDAADFVAWVGGFSGYDSKFDFIKAWDKDSEELEPKTFCKDPNNSLPAEKLLKEMVADDNQQKNLKGALLRVADRLFDLEETKKIVVLIIPYNWQKHVSRLLGIILYLLPNGIQNSLVAVSQVWDKGDLNFTAGLVFTHPNAPYLETIKMSHIKNRVEVFDLTSLASVSGTVLLEATDKNYKQYVLKHWNATKPDGINLLQIFNDLDPACAGKKAILALKGSIDDFLVKDSVVNLTIAEKLEDVIKKLKVFYDGGNTCKEVVRYLKAFVDEAVKKVKDNLKFKERFDALLEIWKHAKIIDLKPDEITKVLESNYKAIVDNYEDILKNSSSDFTEACISSLAKACINANWNHEILAIFENKGVNLDIRSLLNAIEREVFNGREVIENITRKNEISNFDKYLLDVASNWFVLGPSIITLAWNRIKKGGREKDNPCYFSKAIVNLLVENYVACQIKRIDDDQQPSMPQQ